MDADVLTRLTAQSTIGELPAYEIALDLTMTGEVLAATLAAHPEIPGVVLTEGDAVRGTISRGQYHQLVSRQYGREVYHPRPIRLMFETIRTMEELLGPEKAVLCRDYLETLFNPNVIERLVTDINPLRQVETRRSDNGCPSVLAFRFRRSVEDGEIRRLLVRVEDVTREVELAAELGEQERRTKAKVDLIFAIAQLDAGDLARFLSALDWELGLARRLLEPAPDRHRAEERLTILFRKLHMLKGEAGLLKLELFQKQIHRTEDVIVRLRDRGELDLSDLKELEPRLAELERLANETRSLIRKFHELSRVTAAEPATAPVPREPKTGCFAAIAHLVEELSRQLDKPARFVTRATEAEIPEKYHELLQEVLVQFAKNSLVHGLELPEHRRRVGKPALGTLQFAVRRHLEQRQLELVFQDDGAGLDLDKIRRQARRLDFATDDEDELGQLIFRDGFSTADDTSMDAGRGVGMAAVKARIEEHGGNIVAFSQPGRYCAFQIVLPL